MESRITDILDGKSDKDISDQLEEGLAIKFSEEELHKGV